jgi:hypothetical protein
LVKAGRMVKYEKHQSFESMTSEDFAALARAVQSLEHPGFAARLANMAGKPIELIGSALPATVQQSISTITTKALQSALKVAPRTMQDTPHAGSRLVHKVLATASGAAGGAFGLATLPIELPVSTIIMLRAIAEIARSEGEEAKIPPTPKRHSHASKSSHWADAPGRPMLPKAVISL